MKKAPSASARSPCSKSITDNGFVLSRIFIVLLDFSAPAGRYDCHGLSLDGGIQRRVGANAIRSKSNAQYQIKWNPWKIKSVVSALSVNFLSACALSRRRRSKSARYCLPDSSLLLSYNPETSSRVTLASLGTVFQTDHLTTQSSNNKTTKQPNN